jgi:hypothetical protein
VGSDVSLLFEQFILKWGFTPSGKLGREVNWLLEQFITITFGGKLVIDVS